ncbi:Autophagy-related protein 8A [Hibiscus syriacus]|uniref:Autophagy-related protein 8A n=1 Tax=Hibiscus syriacus TaxID=106335 RepID=A0A6A2XZU6_HIBSY|nr:Autophagy-related protein 8A [Hibiscus syriacus]
MSVGQFIHILTRRLQLSPGKALFVFVNNTLPQTVHILIVSLQKTGKLQKSYCIKSQSLTFCGVLKKTGAIELGLLWRFKKNAAIDLDLLRHFSENAATFCSASFSGASCGVFIYVGKVFSGA